MISGYLARHTFPREILVFFTIPPSSVLPWEPRQIFLLECKTIWHFSGEGLLLELHFLLVILSSPTLLCWISVCLQILPMTWADLPFNLCLSSCSIGLSSCSQNSGLLVVKPRNLHLTTEVHDPGTLSLLLGALAPSSQRWVPALLLQLHLSSLLPSRPSVSFPWEPERIFLDTFASQVAYLCAFINLPW